MLVDCPICNQQIMTETEFKYGTCTFMAVMACCCLIPGGMLCPCVPLCFDTFKDVVHFCPKCHNRLGIYKKK